MRVNIIFTKIFNLGLLAAIGFSVLGSVGARAETLSRPSTSNPLSYITQLGNIPFGNAGAAILPESVLSGLTQGKISPIMQFALTNHLMSSCTKDVIKGDKLPVQKGSFVKADFLFDYGKCRIAKCFQQSMLLGLLTELSPNSRVGGAATADSSKANQQMALQLVQAFNTDPCGDEGGDSIDPMLVMLIQRSLQ